MLSPEEQLFIVDDSTDAKTLKLRVIEWWPVIRDRYISILAWVAVVYACWRLVEGIGVISPLLWVETINEPIQQALLAGRDLKAALVEFSWSATIFVGLVCAYFYHGNRSVYLLDFAVYQPPEEWKVTHSDILDVCRKQDCFTEDAIAFMGRVLERSGTGAATHWPPPDKVGKQASTQYAREESAAVLFSVVEEVLQKTGHTAQDIDYLIVNCSIFCPTPSLCAMVANHFGMKPRLQSFNLGGMGCSASVIAIDLAKQLIQGNPGTLALVLSTENLTSQLYLGNQKGYLLQNTLFRVGGAGMLLSSRWQDGFAAKYKLLHTVRTQNTQDDGYQTVFQDEDDAGLCGIRLSKEIVTIAGRCMTDNFTILGPLVLPLWEQIKVLVSIVRRQMNKKATPSYVPDFKKAFDHFCIHAGGRAVIDGIQKNLNLPDQLVNPSRDTLLNYGNTSSSSIWYELAYIEANKEGQNKLKRGDRILQIAFGSGFKCNSAVWMRVAPVSYR